MLILLPTCSTKTLIIRRNAVIPFVLFFFFCRCCVWLSGTGSFSPFENYTAQWLRTKAFLNQWDVINHTSTGRWTPYIDYIWKPPFCVFLLFWDTGSSRPMAIKMRQIFFKNKPESFLQVSLSHQVTLTTPTVRQKTNRQGRLNKQMGCSAAGEVDQWVTKQQHVYPKIAYLQNTQIPQKLLCVSSVRTLTE